MSEKPQTFGALAERVDPARLASGYWRRKRQKWLGQGDISAAYSADVIAEAGRVRKPFRHKGADWVSTGGLTSPEKGRSYTQAWRLVPRALFEGAVATYAERVRDDGARERPEGFYHGMLVRSGGAEYALAGPPVRFVEGETEQLSLF